jgi:hypothetical protein
MHQEWAPAPSVDFRGMRRRPLSGERVEHRRDRYLFPRLPVDPCCIQLKERLPELLVIQHALLNSLIVVDTANHGAKELAIEDEPEIVESVVAGLSGDVGIGEPGLLELIVEVQSETAVEAVDYLGEMLDVRLLLPSRPISEEGGDFGTIGPKSKRPRVRRLVS